MDVRFISVQIYVKTFFFTICRIFRIIFSWTCFEILLPDYIGDTGRIFCKQLTHKNDNLDSRSILYKLYRNYFRVISLEPNHHRYEQSFRPCLKAVRYYQHAGIFASRLKKHLDVITRFRLCHNNHSWKQRADVNFITTRSSGSVYCTVIIKFLSRGVRIATTEYNVVTR